MPVKSYRDLLVWQKSKKFVVDVYRVTDAFPSHEQFGLTNQIRRAAVSVPSNIAEGHVRQSNKVFARHLDIALGSAAEVDTQLEIALVHRGINGIPVTSTLRQAQGTSELVTYFRFHVLDVGYLQPDIHKALAQRVQEIMKMLWVLLRKVRGAC